MLWVQIRTVRGELTEALRSGPSKQAEQSSEQQVEQPSCNAETDLLYTAQQEIKSLQDVQQTLRAELEKSQHKMQSMQGDAALASVEQNQELEAAQVMISKLLRLERQKHESKSKDFVAAVIQAVHTELVPETASSPSVGASKLETATTNAIEQLDTEVQQLRLQLERAHSEIKKLTLDRQCQPLVTVASAAADTTAGGSATLANVDNVESGVEVEKLRLELKKSEETVSKLLRLEKLQPQSQRDAKELGDARLRIAKLEAKAKTHSKQAAAQSLDLSSVSKSADAEAAPMTSCVRTVPETVSSPSAAADTEVQQLRLQLERAHSEIKKLTLDRQCQPLVTVASAAADTTAGGSATLANVDNVESGVEVEKLRLELKKSEETVSKLLRLEKLQPQSQRDAKELGDARLRIAKLEAEAKEAQTQSKAGAVTFKSLDLSNVSKSADAKAAPMTSRVRTDQFDKAKAAAEDRKAGDKQIGAACAADDEDNDALVEFLRNELESSQIMVSKLLKAQRTEVQRELQPVQSSGSTPKDGSASARRHLSPRKSPRSRSPARVELESAMSGLRLRNEALEQVIND